MLHNKIVLILYGGLGLLFAVSQLFPLVVFSLVFRFDCGKEELNLHQSPDRLVVSI